jgi:hypothetical protein
MFAEFLLFFALKKWISYRQKIWYDIGAKKNNAPFVVKNNGKGWGIGPLKLA